MGNPRLVIVFRRTEFQELLDRHATPGQAEFFLRTRGRNLREVQDRHESILAALDKIRAAVPAEWRRAEVERADLSRFMFTGDDLIAVVGQDGLVANTAKYLSGQPVLGIDPEIGTNAGILVRNSPTAAAKIIAAASDPAALRCQELTMVTARLDDGQELSALNEIFVGHSSHQSAHYQITTPDGRVERQSSSGVIISSGTGATGWSASIAKDRGGRALPAPSDPQLAWFVREAWPSPATDASLTEGALNPGDTLRITAASDQLVIFGDGMESDKLTASWGQDITVTLSTRRLRLI